MTQPIGLVGLGNMGSAIASRLLLLGDVIGVDLHESSRNAAAASGVQVSSQVSDLRECQRVVLSLPNPAASRAVVGELARVLPEGAVVLETSTLNKPDLIRNAELLSEHGIRMLDVAILSGVGDMRDGKITLLVGAQESELVELKDILDVLGRTVIPFGSLGAGMVAKVVNNAVAHAVMVVLAEAAAMSAANGVEPKQLVKLLESPDAGLLRPLTHRLGERVLHGDYSGGMPTEAALKDSVLALALAHESGVPLFAIQGSHSVYEIACAQGLERMDYSAIAQLWENWMPAQSKEED